MKRLIPIILILLVIGISPVVSWAGELEDAREAVRKNPNDSAAHFYLGKAYHESGQYQEAIGSLPENVNFGIKASTVRQFLTSSGLPSKKSERTEEKSTEQLAEIAKNQALMVMCLQ